MGDTELGKAVIPIRASLDQLDGDLSDARGRITSALGGVAAGVAAAGTAILGAGTAAVGALSSMAVAAAPLEGIRNAFAGITGDADAMLASLREGAQGMTSDADLMLAYNSAAQLVGKTFADQLPDAMGYLGKVSAATGQDMGYMIDSLVKGVGRLSPMILDNLGIQVNMAEAAAAWAETSGAVVGSVLDNSAAMQVERDAIKQLEQQFAVAEQRQSEFSESTSESTRMAAQFKIDELTADLAEHRDELVQLGMANGTMVESTDGLIESMSKAQQQEAMMAQVMAKLEENTAAMPDTTENASTKLAQFTATMENLKGEIGMAFLPLLTELLGAFSTLATEYGPQITAMFGRLAEMLGPLLGSALETLIPALMTLLDTLMPLGEMIMDQLMPAFASILEVVVSLAGTLIGALAPVLEAVLAALLPVVVTLIEMFAPILADLATGLIPILVPLIEGLGQIFGKLLVAIMPLIEMLMGDLMPIFLQLIETLLPPLIDVLLILMDVFIDYIDMILPVFVELLLILLPIIGELAVVLASGLAKALEALAAIIETVVQPAMQWWMDHIISPLLELLERMRAGLEGITGWFKKLGETIMDLELPPWLIPGSPTPLEIGLSGIGDQVHRVTGLLNGFDAGLSMSVMGGGSGGTWSGDIYINGAGDPQATAAAVIRALQDRGMMPQTAFR